MDSKTSSVEEAGYRDSIMNELHLILSGQRDADSPEQCFNVIAHLWSYFLFVMRKDSGPLDGKDVAVMMGLMKIGRYMMGRKPEDSLIDLAGYAVCAAAMQRAEEDIEDEPMNAAFQAVVNGDDFTDETDKEMGDCRRGG